MFRLDGRIAVVTGATGGIGGAIARQLHTAGAHIIAHGRRRERLDALAEELRERIDTVEGDIVEAATHTALIEAAEAAGGLAILVNNAGITRDGLAMRMKDEDWDSVLDTNLGAVFRLSRGALRPMSKRRFGRIIMIGSVVGSAGNAGQANYAAAKAGLIGLTKSLALELAGRSITVNCIAPGFIETAMTEVLEGERREELRARIPLQRFGQSEDIAASAVFLASDETAYVTGQTLHVNGGMLMP